ncbi:hypothetical protein JCM19037_2874 [Geomicrobium sp. JCM 19037]|uniref:hypothetical protein n=1 Tax=unclassified Geomicrobium TaxID=2628951 RepID=UPI00045F1758|nr:MULTISPECIES: hypothetical protein [unclassified Geomicrobium]GAK04454.1 hypothetical protein JCM19037_2874 [Geomicrobium sp. JCM 19037]GAK11944.1 hypothetical protein JCM19039_1669 [Geomicrobium sp. JCM 19039]
MQLLNEFGRFNLFLLLGGGLIVWLYVDFENPLVVDMIILIFYVLTVALHATRFVLLIKNRQR